MQNLCQGTACSQVPSLSLDLVMVSKLQHAGGFAACLHGKSFTAKKWPALPHTSGKFSLTWHQLLGEGVHCLG